METSQFEIVVAELRIQREELAELRKEQRETRREVNELRSLVDDHFTRPQPKDPVVSLTDAAAQLGFAPDTVRRGRGIFAGLRRYSSRPVKFLQSEIERFKKARAARAHEAPPGRFRLVPRKRKDKK